jgi:hypothetical protein
MGVAKLFDRESYRVLQTGSQRQDVGRGQDTRFSMLRMQNR